VTVKEPDLDDVEAVGGIALRTTASPAANRHLDDTPQGRLEAGCGDAREEPAG